MSAIHVDFAVIGASPQARLIAGLLRSVHGKAVLYQGESQSGYRLPRGLDLSVAPVTRPETWALIKAAAPEMRKLLVRLNGRSTLQRIDAVFCADTEAGLQALGHMRHMAQAFKLPAERVRGQLLGAERQAVVFHDALFLHRASLEQVLDTWLLSIGVHRLPTEADVVLKPDGSAVALSGDDGFEIAQTVLADDAAIIRHVPSERWPGILNVATDSTLLSEPLKPLPAAFIHRLDGSLSVTAHGRSGMAVLGSGGIEQLAEKTRALLGYQNLLRQGGHASYPRLRTSDGAPIVGRLAGSGPDLVAGFGSTGAFFAPALARWLAGAASAVEDEWFKARLVDRDAENSMVSEWDGEP